MPPILLAVRLAAGAAPDAATLAWLRAGFEKFLHGDAPLHVSLRLTVGNRAAARNACLVRAAQILDAGRGLSAWHLAELVRQAVARFESVIAPRIQRGDAGVLTPLDAALHDAFASGAVPLRSQHRIFFVLASASRIESAACRK
ncbi:MAG: hypothetical protein ACK4UX_11400 [Thiobacillus sp.]